MVRGVNCEARVAVQQHAAERTSTSETTQRGYSAKSRLISYPSDVVFEKSDSSDKKSFFLVRWFHSVMNFFLNCCKGADNLSSFKKVKGELKKFADFLSKKERSKKDVLTEHKKLSGHAKKALKEAAGKKKPKDSDEVLKFTKKALKDIDQKIEKEEKSKKASEKKAKPAKDKHAESSDESDASSVEISSDSEDDKPVKKKKKKAKDSSSSESESD